VYTVHVNSVHILPSKARILTAAQELQHATGLDSVSVRNVAAAVALSPSAIYRHYRDKDALLDAMAEEGFLVFEAYLTRAVAESAKPKRLRAIIDAYLRFALEHPSDYEVMFLTPRAGLRRFPADFSATQSRTFAILRDSVDLAMRSEELRTDDPRDTALTIWAHAHGLVTMFRVGRFGDDPERFRVLYHRSFDRILRGLRKPRAK